MNNKIVTGLATLAVAVGVVGCAGDRYTRSTGTYVDDKATSAKVKADLVKDPVVKAFDVNVQTFRGQTQLTGFVNTEEEKARAAEVARNVHGVEWVKNDLIVKTKAPAERAMAGASAGTSVSEPAGAQLSGGASTAGSAGANGNDKWIKGEGKMTEKKAKTDLKGDHSADVNVSTSSNIREGAGSDLTLANRPSYSISVNNGVATLTGTARSQDEKSSVEKQVRSLPGVSRVENLIRVQDNIQP